MAGAPCATISKSRLTTRCNRRDKSGAPLNANVRLQMSEMTVRDALTDAIRYWELRRIAYNAILAVVVAVVFVAQWPQSRLALSTDLAQTLFILAVLANVAYCAAYVVDVVAQYSGFRDVWTHYRWVLFVVGVVFASIIAKFFAVGIFSRAA